MSDTSRPVRKDVLRNRARLLKAADELIAEQGIDLSLNAVARQAGVGVGTVYRHFADREAILAALLEERVERVIAMMTGHLDDDDPVEALRQVVLTVGEMQAADRGMWEMLASGKNEEQRNRMRAKLAPLGAQIVERARASGRVRPGLDVHDLPLLLWISGALSAYAGHVSPRLWRRYLQALLDGLLMQPDEAALEEPALTSEEVDEVMRAWNPGSARPS